MKDSGNTGPGRGLIRFFKRFMAAAIPVAEASPSELEERNRTSVGCIFIANFFMRMPKTFYATNTVPHLRSDSHS